MTTLLALPAPKPPVLDIKTAISNAVHEAVCAYTGTDGFRHCLTYALAGTAACTWVLKRPFIPQICSFGLLIDPPNGWLEIDASNRGIDRGEYHALIVEPAFTDPLTRMGHAKAVIDFSARHWRRLAEDLCKVRGATMLGNCAILELQPPSEHIPWTIAEPPAYFWHDGEQKPPGMYFNAEPEACRELIQSREHYGAIDIKALLRLTLQSLRQRSLLPPPL